MSEGLRLIFGTCGLVMQIIGIALFIHGEHMDSAQWFFMSGLSALIMMNWRGYKGKP